LEKTKNKKEREKKEMKGGKLKKMKKKKENSLLKTGVGLIGANIMVGAVPNISGTAGETGIRSNFAAGTSNVGRALPVMGKVKGAGMVLNSMGSLQKAHKKFKLKKRKGGRKR